MASIALSVFIPHEYILKRKYQVFCGFNIFTIFEKTRTKQKSMNKNEIIKKIQNSKDLDEEAKAILVQMLNERKKYGLVWEEKKDDIFENVEKELIASLPVLEEDTSLFIEAKPMPSKPISNNPNAEQRTIFEKNNIEIDINTEGGEMPPAPNHILIEGDNLHALTALTFTHEGRIDVIYIDPPYNTGNRDFIYNDRFVDKEDGFRHSKWISFMHKRLKIAKKLLKETGVIFLSIDDNEQAQLKLLCDDIFLEKNFVANIIWQSRKSVSSDTYFSLAHNYTLVYARDINSLPKDYFRLKEINKDKFSNPDDDPKGAWTGDPFDAPQIRKNLEYEIINPKTGKIILPPTGRHWATTEENYKKYLEQGRIIFGRNGKGKPQLKRYLTFAENKGIALTTIWNDVGTTTNGTQLLQNIMEGKTFNNPKPISLLNRILKISTKADTPSVILDFFAGSGTTLHATMELNNEDNGTRQCILVTNNEREINIAKEICYERNKRVIAGYTKQNGEAVEGLTNNNVRYYRTKFVGRDRSEKNKKELTQLAVDLLKIRENCYKEFQKLKNIHIFENDIFYLMVIYSDDAILEAIDLIKPLDKKVKVYVFSPSPNSFSDAFIDVEGKIDYCPLPNAIYRVYQHILPEEDKFRKPRIEDGDSELNIDGQTSLSLD